MMTRTIQGLVEGLRAIPERSFTRQTVLREIGRTLIDPASLQPYMFFSPVHYTRNLIFGNDLFELIALGWEAGQTSAVHNHRDQECWMGVPVGRLEIRNFRLVEHDPVARTCRLEPSIRFLIDPEHPAAVDPAEPIHSVHNPPEHGGRAISLHVYSRPFDSCEVYLLDKGRYLDMPLHFTSRFGVLCPGERAVAASPSPATR